MSMYMNMDINKSKNEYNQNKRSCNPTFSDISSITRPWLRTHPPSPPETARTVCHCLCCNRIIFFYFLLCARARGRKFSAWQAEHNTTISASKNSARDIVEEVTLLNAMVALPMFSFLILSDAQRNLNVLLREITTCT